MIQAAAVSTLEPSLFATIILRLFSGREPQLAKRRAPSDAERALLLAIRQRVAAIEEGHEAYNDPELIGYVDHNILEPLRAMMRTAATQWAEPHLERLADLLRESDCALASFDEALVDRGDFLEGLWGLDELHYALSNLTRG
jgi:hypothetical protein